MVLLAGDLTNLLSTGHLPVGTHADREREAQSIKPLKELDTAESSIPKEVNLPRTGQDLF